MQRCNHYASQFYKLVFSDSDLKKLAPSKLEIGTYTTDPVKLVSSCTFYVVHSDTSDHKKWHFMWQVMMAVFYYLMPLHLHLAWSSHTLDWTIYPLEPAWLQAVPTTQRKLSARWPYMYPRRNAWHPINQVVSKLIMRKEHILQAYPEDIFLDHLATYMLIQTSLPSRLHADWCQYISKNHSSKR